MTTLGNETKFKNIFKQTLNLALLLSTTLLVSCSDTPQQYVQNGPPKVDRGDGSQIPTKGDILIPELPTKNEDDLVRAESLQPILYGKGAAGITLKTTFKEAQKILSTPSFGPRPGDGLTLYRSGMIIFWRADEPRIPEAILLRAGYRGSLEAPAPVGPMALGSEFSKHFTDPTGEGFIVQLYNLFENMKPEFNCLKAALCSIEVTDEEIIFLMPKLQLLFSKDLKELFVILVKDEVAKGNLDNDFDVLNGSFTSEAEDPANNVTLSVGETWEALKAKIGTDTDPSVSTKSFGKNFDGVFLGLSKSHYEREYRLPEGSERLTGVTVFNGFIRKLKLNDQYVKLNVEKGAVAVSLVSLEEAMKIEEAVQQALASGTKPADIKEKLLDLNPELKGDERAQLDLLHKLTALIEEQLKAQNPGAKTLTQLSGLYKNSDKKEVVGSVLVVGEKPKSIAFKIRQETGNLAYVDSSLLTDPLNKRVLPAIAEPMQAIGKSLAGFTLGETVKVTDIDAGRLEATIEGARGDYSPKAILRARYVGEDSPRLHQVELLNVSDLGVKLGVVKTSAEKPELRTIVSISTSAQVAPVVGVCGLASFNPTATMQDTNFMSSLKDAISKGANAKCDYVVEKDSTGIGSISSVTFVKEQIIFGFSEHELGSVSIYMNPHAIQQE